MSYLKFPKIHRLGKEETDGILDHEVVVQEKIDGANGSIFLKDGKVEIGSRTRQIGESESFNGFREYVESNKKINTYLESNSTKILYGEWLTKHSIDYPATAYRKFYLFDIYDQTNGEWLAQSVVERAAKEVELPYPHIFAKGKLTLNEINEYVGKSVIAPEGEGVVIKSQGFVNKFGDHAYAKVVTQKFRERNAITFGGNNKHSETYWEMYVVNRYATLARVQKVMQKTQSQIDERLDMQHIPRIANSCYHDMLTEEIWEIQGRVPKLDLKALRRLSTVKFIQIYKDILNDQLSVAYQQH